MAVNQTKCQNGQLFLNGDYVIIDKNGVEFSFEKSNALPGYLQSSRNGRLILTGKKAGVPRPKTDCTVHHGELSNSASQIIFISAQSHDQCQTITLDFHYIRNMEVKQPIFGANYLQADITAEPGAGWQGDAVFKISFSKGGAIEFAEAFQRAIKNARVGATAAMHQPVHQPQMNGQSYPAPPQPANGHHGYQQPGPYGGYGAPPPYQPQPYPPQYTGAPPTPYNQYQGMPPPAGAKEAEAYASGQNVYVPAPQNNGAPSAPPPPYDDHKKQQ